MKTGWFQEDAVVVEGGFSLLLEFFAGSDGVADCFPSPFPSFAGDGEPFL